MFAIIAISLLIVYIYLGFKKPAIALVTSPFVTIAVIFGGAVKNSEFVVIAPVLLIATVMTVAISKREPDSEQWPQIWAKWILIIFILLLLLITMGVVFGPLGIAGFVLFVLFDGSIIAYSLTSRHATATYIISTIGSSIRQNLPLPMALESAASGNRDSRSRILQRIQKWLVQGYSLSESIKRGYPKCPGYAVAMIAAAERIDQLPSAIKAIEADMIAKADESRRIRPVHPLYPVILMTFMFLILLGLMKFVIPQFKTVLEEMTDGATLPAATLLIMRIASFIAFEYGWLIGLVLVLIILVAVPCSIYIKFRPRRPQKPYMLSRLGDFIKWHLPVLHWFERNYSMVQVVALLRLSLNAGCTVNDAICDTISLDINNCFKKRLKKWLEKVERGDDVSAAARESKLGSTLAWTFDQKVNQGNTLAILETLESFYRSNYSYRVNLTRFIIWPCVSLMMGVIVGFVVYAIFSPGIATINSLANLVTP